jgi:two-component system chemotaxis response regulator CheY
MRRNVEKPALRVLVVDDARGVRESIRIALEAAGMEVSTCADGEEALRILSDAAFDCVVTDIWMPSLDGLDLIKQLHATKPNLRVFVMTGGGPRMSIESAAAIAEVWGAERVFVKPFDEQDLLEAIQSGAATS